MRSRWGVLVLAAAVLGAAAIAGAGSADVGIAGGYQRLSEGEDGAFVGGGYLRLDWHEVVFIETRVLYHNEDLGNDRELELIPIQLSAMLFFLRRDLVVSPYVLAGVGGYITRQVENAKDESDSSFDFGWHLGGGLDWNLTDRIFVEADLRYIWLDVDFSGQTVGEKLANANSWMATTGFGFRL
jgi:opacity protein-like surface antigen